MSKWTRGGAVEEVVAVVPAEGVVADPVEAVAVVIPDHRAVVVAVSPGHREGAATPGRLVEEGVTPGPLAAEEITRVLPGGRPGHPAGAVCPARLEAGALAPGHLAEAVCPVRPVVGAARPPVPVRSHPPGAPSPAGGGCLPNLPHPPSLPEVGAVFPSCLPAAARVGRVQE